MYATDCRALPHATYYTTLQYRLAPSLCVCRFCRAPYRLVCPSAGALALHVRPRLDCAEWQHAAGLCEKKRPLDSGGASSQKGAALQLPFLYCTARYSAFVYIAILDHSHTLLYYTTLSCTILYNYTTIRM